MCNLDTSDDTGGELEFQLRYDVVALKTGRAFGDLLTFNISLIDFDRPNTALSGLSGFLLNVGEIDESEICVTIHDALKRHTRPKNMTLANGANVYTEFSIGTDSRIFTTASHVLFLWLPEIYDDSMNGVGTKLLMAFLRILGRSCLSIVIDFDVQNEQDGYIKIFFPALEELGLTLSENGQFAHGEWGAAEPATSQVREIGVVYS